ncbi:MAG: CRTAC1 family protein, partial [Gammaproteobacteria bacterium]|nr:CRTAC1 family protein [Gammaproteobacteria bacterium]
KEKVESVCRDKTYISTTSRNAVAERNVDICNALSTPERIGECLIGFVKEYQFNNDNPELCNSIQSITARAICMNAVINSRISMRNKEACDVSYFSRKEKVLCFDKMNAAIASDYKSIDVCNMLSTQGSRELCITDVSGMYIYLHHNYDICDSIQNDRLKGQCSRNSIYAKAQEQGDVKLCNSLDVTEVSFCELSVLLKGFEKSRSRHINSIASPDVQNEQGGVFYHSEKHHPRKNINWTHEGGSNNLEIWSVPHVSSVNTKESKFHKVAGEGVGFENVWSMSLSDFVDPFVYGKGIATGDYNNDGWPDVLVATEKGVNLYTNIDGGRFSYTLSLNPPEYIANTFVVTFVDINNDGWLDIYFSSYSKGNYIALSNKGKFLSDNIHRLESKKSIVSLASGFYDLDLDGDLDMVVGNWSFGQDKGFVPKLSDNIWYYNDNNTFKAYYPEEEKGETLSVLLSDMNNDSLAEMFIANDRGAPDVIYLSNKEGVGTRVHSMSNRMPVTSFNTMSYESADFNNDLNFDVFSTDMTIGKGKDIHYCEVLDDNIRGECFELLSVQKEIKSLNVSWCNGLSDDEKDECYSAMIMQLIKRDADAALCEKIPLSYSGKREFCYNMLEDIKNEKSNFSNASIRQVESNKMLFGDGKGNFSDVTNVMGVGNSFWSWNAKAADLDNDEWQDIYVANGFGFSEFRSISSNVLFRNITGNKFVRSESEFGLENYSNTPSYTYFDYDRDGDIDILSTSIMSGLSLFVNNSVNTNSIVFDLRDFVANRFCVGCKLIIKYNQGKSSQIREIKLSGGFMSYDEPIAHFGLGEYEHIDGVSVVWSDGERIDIDQKFMSGYRYKLIRNK